MDTTGSTNNVLHLLGRLKSNNLVKEKSSPVVKENILFKELTVKLSSLSKTKDITGVLNFERSILKYELSRCNDTIQDKGRITSLSSAVRDLDNAREIFDNVFDPIKYKPNSYYSDQKIDRTSAGLPKDAFHRFIDSHRTRLSNRLISDDGSFEKRNLLKTRYESMSLIKKEYMKLQSKALNIPLPEKSKERER